MKNIFKISTLSVIAAVAFSSCIKEAQLTGGATEEQVTLETLIQGIPAALVQAGSTGYGLDWDFAYPAIHLATESMTGDLVVPGNTGYDWFSQWGSNIALGSEYAVGALPWNNFYSWIMSANSVIRRIGNADFSALDSSEKQYLGYAYAYRALFYFDLVRMYEFKRNKYTEGEDVIGLGVPIVLPETTEAQAKNNPRAKVSDIYDTLIFPDLEKAEELLSSFKAADKYTISIALIYGMKARAYLERATSLEEDDDKVKSAEYYASAATYARKAIETSGCTPLTQDQWEDPSNGFNNANSNNAWIWGLAIPSESVSNLLCFTAHMSTENAWSAYGHDTCRAINKNLYNSISGSDFRKHSWLDPDRNYYNYKSCRKDAKEYFAKLKNYSNIKFRPAQGAYEDYITGGAADHCMMRVEEMYFIEAEAKAHEKLSEGIRLLNEFMNNYRIVGDRKYDCSAKASTMTGFINELILQKRVEFWGEGIIMFDMKRLNISSKRGYTGTNAPASYRINCEGRAPYWNFVIGRNEMQNNPAVANQNNPDPSQVVPLWK